MEKSYRLKTKLLIDKVRRRNLGTDDNVHQGK